MRRSLMLLALLPTMAACSTDCSTTTNVATAAGTIRDVAGVALASADAAASEEMRSPERWALRASIWTASGPAGAPLKGHIIAARLLYPSGMLLYAVPATSSIVTPYYVTSLQVVLPNAGAYASARDALMSGRVKLVLETDLPGLERLETTLTDARYQPAERRRCPYT